MEEGSNILLALPPQPDQSDSAEMASFAGLSRVFRSSQQYDTLPSQFPTIATPLNKVAEKTYTVRKDDKVTAFETTPSGECFALLLGNSLEVYSLEGRNDLFFTESLKVTVRWKKITIGGYYVALYGIERCKDPHKLVCSLTTQQSSSLNVVGSSFRYEKN